MLTDRSSLEQLIETNVLKIILDTKQCNKLYSFCYEQYNIPKGTTSDFITMRMPLTNASNFVLFALLDGLDHVMERPSRLTKFFTESEIKKYKSEKLPDAIQIEFPLKLRMIQVENDQWIGRIDVDMLMQLRRAQLIKYNEETQRAMECVIRNNQEFYQIAINKVAVGQIKDLLEAETYIPDDITLNMTMDDPKLDFSYNESQAMLIIRDITAFDIIDGYHRYVALSREKDINPDFNYPMELRITNYTEDKAKRFIFQKDQKTKMRKIDSDSYNVDSPAHITVTRLNESPKCNIRGLISKTGLIPFPETVEWVNALFFKDVPKTKQRVAIMETVKELTEDFNLLTEYNVKYMEQKYSYKMLIVILYVFSLYQGQDKTKMCEVIEESIKAIQDNNSIKFKRRQVTRSTIAELNKIVRTVEEYV